MKMYICSLILVKLVGLSEIRLIYVSRRNNVLGNFDDLDSLIGLCGCTTC